jgi:hypothetical protein
VLLDRPSPRIISAGRVLLGRRRLRLLHLAQEELIMLFLTRMMPSSTYPIRRAARRDLSIVETSAAWPSPSDLQSLFDCAPASTVVRMTAGPARDRPRGEVPRCRFLGREVEHVGGPVVQPDRNSSGGN